MTWNRAARAVREQVHLLWGIILANNTAFFEGKSDMLIKILLGEHNDY